MRKLIYIAVCTFGLLTFSSCGSSKSCGLASKTRQTKQIDYQQEPIVAEATVK